jgi:hypothetical protein
MQFNMSGALISAIAGEQATTAFVQVRLAGKTARDRHECDMYQYGTNAFGDL